MFLNLSLKLTPGRCQKWVEFMLICKSPKASCHTRGNQSDNGVGGTLSKTVEWFVQTQRSGYMRAKVAHF